MLQWPHREDVDFKDLSKSFGSKTYLELRKSSSINRVILDVGPNSSVSLISSLDCKFEGAGILR